MAKVLLVTAPFSGTHFAAYLLHLLGADFTYNHAFNHYLRADRIPQWLADGAKLIITLRNPWDSLFSAWNRRRVFYINSPDVLATEGFIDPFPQQLASFSMIDGLRSAAFELYIDNPPGNPQAFVQSLADYCEVPVTLEATTFASAWPITGSIEYSSIETPPATDIAFVEALCTAWGYPTASTWDAFTQNPRIGLTREDIRPLIEGNRSILGSITNPSLDSVA